MKIIGTQKNSPARRLKIPPGELVEIGGEKAADILDVAYYDGMNEFSVTVETGDGLVTKNVKKDSAEELGLILDDDSYLKPNFCRNKCIFCFVDQLPKGMRKTLYVKDDDWRLSFACGNYVTFTNLTDEDKHRIVAKKFSPLYVSVHATDTDLRRFLLGNPKAEPIMPLLKLFAENGITMNTQIVLCPDINDGENLRKTLRDLRSLYPSVKSVAIVPVGLTCHREKLFDLKPYTVSQAREVILLVDGFNREAFGGGEGFAYCSDEFYIDAGLPLPDADKYGDFDQIENGVGIVAQMRHEFNLAISDATSAKETSFTLVCGESGKAHVEEMVKTAEKLFPKLKTEVIAIKNDFFGHTITVSGLVTGRDIAAQLHGREVGDVVLIPAVMLREFQDVFLDGTTLAGLEKTLGRKIEKITDGYALCAALLNGDYV